MKSATVEGRFSRQHCYNKSLKRHPGQIKPTLLFKGSKKPSDLEPKDCSFLELLRKKELDVDLGPVDKNWFEKALNNEIGTTALPSNDFQENSKHESNVPTLAREITETPQRAVASQLPLSPCLFTPDNRRSVSQQSRIQDNGQASLATSQHPLRDDISPATPSLVPITPNLPAEKRNPAQWTPAKLDAIPSPHTQGIELTQEEPSLGGWFPIHKQTTPTFMKQLFKTPSTVSKLEDISIPTPGQFLSTPLRMSVSLGVDLDDSNLSWTSSLATPQGSSRKTTTLAASNVDRVLESTVIAKALFTSATKPQELCKPRRSIDPDSQFSTLPLQSLHLSSAEEEEELLEDTIESDHADNGAGREDHERLSCGLSNKCTTQDVDDAALENEREHKFTGEKDQVFKGRDLADDVLREVVLETGEDEPDGFGGATAEQVCSAHSVQTLTTVGSTTEPRSTEVDRNGESFLLFSNKPQDNVDQKENRAALIPQTELAKDNPEIASLVEQSVGSQAPEQTVERPRTGSQKSLENLAVNDLQVLETSDRSALDRSRMEDTLAFLLLTPPQTRGRLAKLKTHSLAKDGASVPKSSVEESRADSEGPAFASLEESHNLQTPSRADRNHELLQETEDLAPTKKHTSVITLKEVDGSLKEFVENLSELTPGFKCTNPGICESLSSLHSEEETNKVPVSDAVRESQGDIMVDACDVRSQENLAYPPSVSHNTETISSPTLPVPNIASLTPVRQAQMLVSPPYMNSPDIFSQISPNFAEALCTITDQASEYHHAQSMLLPVPEENVQSASNRIPAQHQSEGSPVSCKSPPLPEQQDSKPAPLNSNSNCTLRQTPVFESVGQSQKNPLMSPRDQETPSQLFRMQPKAATTRKFFYPSAATASTKAKKPKAMQWVADAVFVKAEEQQQPSAQETRQDKSLIGKTDTEASAAVEAGSTIYSSTPAPRNSAFVSFTNFIKSEKSSASGTSNPPRLTPIETASAQSRRMPSVTPHQHVPQSSSIPMENISNSSKTSKTTTPLSRRTVAPRSNTSYCGVRRRAGNRCLPAPKRLKTAMEDDKEHTEAGETLNQVEPLNRFQADKTVPSSGILGSNAMPTETQIQASSSGKITSNNAQTSFRSMQKLYIGRGNTEVTDAKRCTTFKLNSNQQMTTQMDLSSTNAESIKPALVGFASASGKPINISDSALEKAKRLLSDSEEERIPNSVGFASASGKAIQISDSALKKAVALFDENDGEQSVHSRFACPAPTKDELRVEEGKNTPQHSRICVKAPDCAQQKVINDHRERVVSIDPTVVPGLASMKSNQVPEYGPNNAELRSKDEHDAAVLDVDTNSAKPMRGISCGINQLQEAMENAGGITSGILSVASDSVIQKAKATQCEQVPSFTRFASASGKAIAIPESALQQAQKMFDDVETETQPTTGFASAAGRPIQISQSDLMKARALLDDCEESSLPKAQSHPQHVRGRDSQNIVQQQLPKPQPTKRNLLKGFRPFKAPARVHTATRQKTPVKHITQAEGVEKSLTLEAGTSDHAVPCAINPKQLQSIPESSVLDLPPEPLQETKTTVAESMEFEEEFLSASQAQREIEAAEEMESAYAFMQAQNDSFSQFEESTVDGLDPVGSIKCPVENMKSVAAEQYAEESKNLKLITDEEHVSGPLGFNVAAAVSGSTATFINSSKSSVPVVDCPFVGFQTASGTKITLSEEALQKAKTLLDTEIDSIPLEARKNCRTSGKTTDQNTKTNPAADKIVSGFQTADGNMMLVSRECFDRARKLISETSEQFDQQPTNDETPPIIDSEVNAQNAAVNMNQAVSTFASRANNESTAKVTPRFPGFQTAGGKNVSISEEALKRARNLLSEEEMIGSCLQTGNMQPHESIGTKTQVALTRCSPRQTTDNVTDQPDGDISDKGGTRSSDISSTRPNCVPKKPEGKCRTKDLGTHTVRAGGDAQLCGFTTASGTKVTISEESLQQAKTFLDDPHEGSTAEKTAPSTPRTEGSGLLFKGFSTASGNKVSVSNAALKRAKKLLHDPDDDLEVPVAFDKKFPSRPDCKRRRKEGEPDVAIPIGFQTASGTQVSISEASLQKAKNLLDDSPERSNSAHKASSGFQTASGNKVSVSAQSLANAQRLLADAESAPEHGVPSNQKKPLLGFSTASGAQVSVSEAALEKARRFFQETDDDLGVSRGSTAVADQDFSKAHLQPGGKNTDAVVPHFGGSTSNRRATVSQNFKTKAAVSMPGFHQGPLAKPPMISATKQRSGAPLPRQGTITSRKPPTAFQPPFQTAQDQTPQSRPRPGKPPSGLQVVPQIASPLTRTQERGQPNKRGLVKEDQQASGPLPKRARLEAGVEGEAGPSLGGKTRNTKEQETSMPVAGWEQARQKQASRIQGKKIQVIKPQPGRLFTKRQHEPRMPLCELVNGQPPQQCSSSELVDNGVLHSTLTVTSPTAEAFRFSLTDHYSPEALETSEGLMLGDGGRLVPDTAGTAGTAEFFNALLDTPGVDPKLLTSDWVSNHYHWIVWKLASMERAYPQHLAGRLVTPDWVLVQLKFRYDREIDHTQRSALKKILERDDAASKRMVLCVAGIHLEENSTGAVVKQEGTSGKEQERISSRPVPTLELTDGWYSIRTVIDKPLAGLVHAGKIYVGQKLCIYAAELIGSQDACSPLEVPASLKLKISANATRRARYDARLGLQPHPQPFPLPLTSLYPEGGPVGCVDVVVVRSYSMQFMEKHSEGGCTFRGRRAEEKEAARFAQEKQKRMERLYNQIHEEYQEKENKKANPSRRSSSAQKLTAKQVGKLQTGQELYEALNNAMDPGAIEALLSERQMAKLHDYQRSLHERKQADLQGQFKRAMEDKQQENQIQRNVTPLLRLRVADHLSKPGSGADTYQLTVWRPTDDVLQLLSEGKRLKIFNLSTSAGRFCVGSSSIQLASTRATRYQAMPSPDPSAPGSALYQPRQALRFTEALQAGFQPAYGEVDVVGVVVTVQGDATNPGKSSSQIVYLCDAEGNFIAIKFWGGLQAHCMETLVQPGAVIATASLQWRSNSASSSIPCLHATDTTSVTQSPKAEHLRAALQDLQSHIKDPKAFAESMEPFAMEMIHKQSRHPSPMTPRPENAPFGMSPWSDSRPSRGTTTPRGTLEMGTSSFSGNAPSFSPVQTYQSFPSPASANWTHQRPDAASTPMTSRGMVASTPGGRPPLGVVSTPVMTPDDKRKLDVRRRYDLLSRVPSPPPLSPLPIPTTNRVARSFRLPSSRRNVPRQGLSYGSSLHNTPGLKSHRSEVKHDSFYYQGGGILESEGCAPIESGQSLKDRKPAAFTTPAKDTKTSLDVTNKSENSPEEDMTPSQRQIQEVLGMSYKSLREINLECTQQMDPPYSPEPQGSQPSPDFSYDTPSQSSSVKEEATSALSSKSTRDLNENDAKLIDEKRVATSKTEKGDSQSNKPLTSKKNLGRRSRRGLIGREASVATLGVTSQEQKLMGDKQDQNAKGSGMENQMNKQQATEETDVKGKEQPTDVDGNQKLKNEQEALEEVAKAEDATRGPQVSPKSVSDQKKRRARSRADLSILEQSSLLGHESGEPTRRLTRSTSRRSTVK